MTNVNDTEAEITKDQFQNSNTTAGVGANANLTVDMTTFVGSDTLAELVWSPRRGLSIKFADKKPCFMCEVGPSDIGFLRSEEIEDEKRISEGRSVGSRAIRHASGRVGKSSSSAETTKSISYGHTGPQNQRAAEPQSEHLFEDGVTGGVMMQCGPKEHIIKENVKKENNGCFGDPFREHAVLDNKKGDEESSFNCRKSDENHHIESHGSMESFKSDNLSTKRKRKSNFEKQLILGSKRIKTLAHESVLKNDSSFVSWISNMLKGLKDHENYNQRVGVCDESRRFESGKTGFQNVFRSLFSQNIENKSVGSSKETDLTDKCSHESLNLLEIKKKEAEVVVRRVSLYERITKEAPKGMFDTIRMLRLSRTDILKWTNSRLSVASLDGFFLRLRVAKWEEGQGGSRYYVACITGLQGETPLGGFRQPIRVKVGGVECFVESRYVSNCDFLEEELVAWWQKTSKTGGTPFVKDLKSKLAERRALGV